MSIDLFAAEALIIARLRALVSVAGVKIGSAAAVAGRTDMSAFLPGAFVLPGAAQRVDFGDEGALILENQTWTVVCVAALNRDTAGLNAQYSATLGGLAEQVLTALSGWLPAADFKPLIHTHRDAPQVQQGGWVELALSFETIAPQGV